MTVKKYKPRHLRESGFKPRTFDLERDKRQALYRDNTTWRKFSYEFLRANPECYMCGQVSEVTDHIEPHLGRVEVFERDNNFLALCFKCHNTVTGKFDYRYRVGASLEPKIKFMNEERARNEILSGRTFPKPKAMRYK